VVACPNVESGVPSQPGGKEQTEQGARNRAQSALSAVEKQTNDLGEPSPTFGIGIENGMWEQDSVWVDGACLVILGGWCKEPLVIWSDTVVIPPVEERCSTACTHKHTHASTRTYHYHGIFATLACTDKQWGLNLDRMESGLF
jgi:hypothetical protein